MGRRFQVGRVLVIERLVAFSVRHRWVVIAVVAMITAASTGVAAHLFRINTDVERLIDPKEPWRQDEINYEKAFPQRTNTVVAVIDGKTPEQAEEAATALAKGLVAHKNLIETVYRPDGGPFFEKNGFLLLSQPELEKTTEQLVQQQGLLGPLASDPSLRGVMRVLSLGARGIKSGDAKLEDLEKPMGRSTRPCRRFSTASPPGCPGSSSSPAARRRPRICASS